MKTIKILTAKSNSWNRFVELDAYALILIMVYVTKQAACSCCLNIVHKITEEVFWCCWATHEETKLDMTVEWWHFDGTKPRCTFSDENHGWFKVTTFTNLLNFMKTPFSKLWSTSPSYFRVTGSHQVAKSLVVVCELREEQPRSDGWHKLKDVAFWARQYRKYR